MNTALVIVDMQKGFVNKNTLGLSDRIVDFVNNNDFYMIIGTKYVNDETTSCHIYEGWDGCWTGTDEAELIDSINSVCDVVISKNKYSCWNASFIQLIDRYNIDRLVFCGVNTGCCVLASAFDAYDDVRDIMVIEDLCGSTSGIDSHNAGIRILKECITKDRVIMAKDYCKSI